MRLEVKLLTFNFLFHMFGWVNLRVRLGYDRSFWLDCIVLIEVYLSFPVSFVWLGYVKLITTLFDYYVLFINVRLVTLKQFV